MAIRNLFVNVVFVILLWSFSRKDGNFSDYFPLVQIFVLGGKCSFCTACPPSPVHLFQEGCNVAKSGAASRLFMLRELLHLAHEFGLILSIAE